jgi:hypothetical protein
MYVRCLAALAAAALMSGCAIHPVPEDVTGLDTADIVKQIRCETRDAARKIMLDYLEKLATDGHNPTAQNLVTAFRAEPETMDGFNPAPLFPGESNKNIRNFFTVVYSTAIAYSFDLTMEEVNNLGGTVNFLGPWQNVFTLGITGNANRSRQNLRTFTITDKFNFLLRQLNTAHHGHRYCDNRTVGPNYIYPIAGQIGVYNTVYTYLQLSVFENLAPDKAAAGADAPPLGDKLTFITGFDLSANPRVVFAPLKSAGFQIADATVPGMLSRKDTHQVTVGLAMEPSGSAALASLSGFVFSGAGLSGPRIAFRGPGRVQTVGLDRVVANTTSRAEQLALLVVDQLKRRDIQLIAPQIQ